MSTRGTFQQIEILTWPLIRRQTKKVSKLQNVWNVLCTCLSVIASCFQLFDVAQRKGLGWGSVPWLPVGPCFPRDLLLFCGPLVAVTVCTSPFYNQMISMSSVNCYNWKLYTQWEYTSWEITEKTGITKKKQKSDVTTSVSHHQGEATSGWI